jgi:hypothetical protein
MLHLEAGVGAMFLAAVGYVIYQAKKDGLLYWDKYARTRIIRIEQ